MTNEQEKVKMLLAGRKAIVTGASSGIGKATAERLAHEGASVCVNYHSVQERAAAEEVGATVERAGGQVLLFQADVGDEAQVRQLVTHAAEAFGG